ncbi:hypothetical protein GIB67_034266 [Kingdonia uniflora]|uniref:Plant heme peroxidase family profile domain-containing protein n=1 Tax=Kingdonia uniflora TaxID=39325 RepID=A0A7J7NSC3_9MAGN|nr:hypothetical protein GIB67_034266 [Kingdonia uniflora]
MVITGFGLWDDAVSLAISNVATEVGCNVSLLLDDTSSFNGEKTVLANVNSARWFDVIDTIKTRVESVCAEVVSCVDILAIAVRGSIVVVTVSISMKCYDNREKEKFDPVISALNHRLEDCLMVKISGGTA